MRLPGKNISKEANVFSAIFLISINCEFLCRKQWYARQSSQEKIIYLLRDDGSDKVLGLPKLFNCSISQFLKIQKRGPLQMQQPAVKTALPGMKK
jgi:hypothetical protein